MKLSIYRRKALKNQGIRAIRKKLKKCKKSVDIFFALLYNNSCVTD
ncbi:hypothetical protein ROSEINA2194_01332 [Roseburia inulinivorans DSM 16841]|uniref:Uncharacterized protein n=1 Tax=Roseburia inulinivorans DSM 16841 TaxID=622312 RepID=C0FRH1_9FIRM|nr:hypothetical protein ROSEINA2194_01332 [Roseburia inulinivorans DSM 16841]